MSGARKLSSTDASFLYLETPEMPMHVGSIAIFRLPENYDGNFFEDFKAMIASRLHVAPILKSRLEKAPLDIDHPSWVEDDQFDIDRHIFRGSLPAPYDRATLERIVGRDFGMPPKQVLRRARALDMASHLRGVADQDEAEELALRYYDQSHLIREFTELFGMSPGQFVATPQPILTLALESRQSRRLEALERLGPGDVRPWE